MLKEYIASRKRDKEILLMTHLVIGYPSLTECFQLVVEMDKADVDIIELQIPHHNAYLDGVTIRNANNQALANGIDVEQCFKFALYHSHAFSIPVVIVAYYETLKEYGLGNFFTAANNSNVMAIIIPDLPENIKSYAYMLAFSLGTSISPVIFPNTLNTIDVSSFKYSEFCYCATHNGNTGDSVEFNTLLLNYINSVRKNITQPIAVGFGIKNKSHINFLKGHADIAVIGTQIMKVIEKDGINEVGRYLEKIN